MSDKVLQSDQANQSQLSVTALDSADISNTDVSRISEWNSKWTGESSAEVNYRTEKYQGVRRWTFLRRRAQVQVGL